MDQGQSGFPMMKLIGKFLTKDSNKSPLKDRYKIKNFKTGEWSLLKGGSWQENFNGVVHRSPHNNEERLLLSIDPYF